MIKGLIFDFDGLILDTETPIFQSWDEIFRQHGCQLSLSDWADYIGRSEGSFDFLIHLEAQVGSPIDRAGISRTRREREAWLIEQQPILPGVQESLRRAQDLKLRLGVASSSSCEWVTGNLTRLGLNGYFECIRGADDVRVTKPAPDLYLDVLEGLGLQAGEAVALEDSPNGVTAAKRAGLYCIAIPNPLTRQLNLAHADLRLDSLLELDLDGLLSQLDGKSRGER